MTERAADRLARRLFEAGVRHAFGIPGGEVLVLMDALERAGIRYVQVKHESAGGFMAEAVWQRTGAPGVLVATVGPGLANAVNAVANAALDRVPLVVLAGCVDAADRLTYTHQVLDHAALVAPAVKASFTLTASTADLVAERAIRLATDPRPGPVHVDVPIALAGAAAEPETQLRRGPRVATAPAPGPALDTARAWLARADRPLVIAGFDAVQDRAGPALRAFAHRLRAPVIQTYKAKGLLAEDDPWALAPAALSPAADAVLLAEIARADAIVLAGYDAVEMRPGWRRPWDPRTKRVVDVAPLPNDHYLHHGALDVVADVGATLAALADGVEGRSSWTTEEVAERRAAARAPFRPDEDWGPAAITEVARRVLPRDTIATTDAGAHRILFSQLWRAYAPRTLLQSNGLCTMGGALPLAMGAKLAEPARPAVAFLGDGGLLMGLGELATAAELGLAVVVVVFVDRSLALIEQKQREVQLPASGVALGAVDLAAAARALGGEGAMVGDRAGLETALARALVAERFTVIACEIAARAYDGRI
ncbi:MAG: thiamine pyrophosphate-binding protein [Alphaproteobacteria bacterium]|jgi:acetolactate synthase-1/2/3 large subunit|nr:thiamine pyrophosphate-binding protein [Alphaproteobacteria bacterium]